ncbi:MAG: DUF1552 domain-containing protein [Prosthecobacter sp.]|uniref:DUF1552 domain-containing protein n=1 Tax=Prosthecobacter sp. TaxID=1965333 RepID=UPI003901F80B
MHINRRNFIKGSSAMLGLPWLESLGGFAHAADSKAVPQRLILIGVPLGLYREALMPKAAGVGYETSEYLSIIDEFRDHFTVISGLDHPGVGGGHSAEARIFTGQPSNVRNVRSLDQYIAAQVGQETRFDSLALSVGHNQFSWTDSGSMVPAESKMANVYAKLFVSEGRSTADKVIQEIGQGKSIMDLVQRQAKSLKPQLSQADQEKLEEYFDSVRETERRLVKSESWVHTAKPQVDAQAPRDPTSPSEIVTQLRNVCDMTYLAFKTDSTRVVTFSYFQQNNVNIQGVSNGYHSLSHHGMDANNITQLKLVEKELFKELKTLLTNLKNAKEGDSNLLDRTTILVTSSLGNASNHSNKDLPVLLMGGRFKHGQHLAFDPSTVPLSNLYVSVLNQFGLADKKFGTATGPLKGLEFA